jgi:hypothetical protein
VPTAVERGSVDCKPIGNAHRVNKATTRPGTVVCGVCASNYELHGEQLTPSGVCATYRHCISARSNGCGTGEQAGVSNIPPQRVGALF